MDDFDPIPYRIRIGVTGHRNLHDPAAMEALVKKAIDAEWKNCFPKSRDRSSNGFAGQGRLPFRSAS